MNQAKRSHWPFLALLAIAVFLAFFFYLRTELALTDGVLGVPLDDAWIHYQFARNLSQGHGFSYNPGDPTPGSTAPLWTLLLAGAGFFTHDFIIPSLLLSGGFFLATVWLVYGLATDLTGRQWVGLGAGLAAALTGRFLWAGLAGMETTAFAALSLAAVWWYTRRGLVPGAALLFALAGQLRPEGHLLFGLAVLLTVWRCLGGGLTAEGAENAERKTGGEGWRPLSRRVGGAVLIYALVAAPYALFSWGTTGRPLPNTFYAKVGSQHFFSWQTLSETLLLHWRDNPVSLSLALLGIPLLWRRSRLAAAWLVLLPLVTAVIIDFVWHHGRYTMPLIPFQMLAAALAVAWLAERLPREGWLNRRVGGALLLILLALGGAPRLDEWARMLGQNAHEVMAIDLAMGKWLHEHTPENALIAVDDIGAIAFLAEREIFDLNGLVTPAMWPAMRGGDSSPLAVRLMADAGVTHLAIFPGWHAGLAATPGLLEPMRRWTVDTHTIIGEPETAVYRPHWPYQETVALETPSDAQLGGNVSLLGYDFAPPDDAASPLSLTLYWECRVSLGADYTVFVHILDEAGQIVAQQDRPPYFGMAPTSLWQAGDVIRDPFRIDLPPELPPGAYTVSAGLYDPESGARLPVSGAVESEGNAIYLTTFTRGQ